MRKLKVYGWQGWRNECRPAANGSRATREICAAPSAAAVARAAGVSTPARLWCLCETGNTQEVETAMRYPGIILWRPLDDYNGKFRGAPCS